jgi:hypothetical protein
VAAGLMVRDRSGRAGAAGRRTLVAGLIAVGGLLAGCAGGAPAGSTVPPPTAQPTAPASVEATLAQLDGALRARGLVLQSTRTEVRPAEPPSFADVARWPAQALLSDDPGGGYFVIYAFADADLAAAGGRDLAAYVASGPGRIQFPPDVRFVLRQVGATLVFYPWSPASSPDPKTPDLAAALASVGTDVPIPPG